MKKPKEWVVMALLVFALVCVCVFITALHMTNRSVEHAVAEVEKPEALVKFEEMISASTEAAEAVVGTEGIAESRRDPLGLWAEVFERKHNEWDTDKHCRAKINRDDYYDFDKWPEATRQEFIECIKKHRELIELIVEAAEIGGPIFPRAVHSYVLAADFQGKRDIYDILDMPIADAVVRIHEGDADMAFREFIALAKIADALRDDPSLCGMRLRFFIRYYVGWEVKKTFKRGEVPSDLALALAGQLGQAEESYTMAEAVEVERHFMINTFPQFSELGIAAWADEMGPFWGTAGWVYTRPMFKPLYNVDQVKFIDISELLMRIPDQPYFEIQPELDSVAEKIEDLTFTQGYSTRALPELVDSFESLAWYRASADLTRIGLLLERHYALNGEYPASLEDIRSELGGAIPLDPFSGEPYRYKTYEEHPDTFLLYSLGRNMKDDEGAEGWDHGDIVWR